MNGTLPEITSGLEWWDGGARFGQVVFLIGELEAGHIWMWAFQLNEEPPLLLGVRSELDERSGGTSEQKRAPRCET